MRYVQNSLTFCASLWDLTSGKNVMVIRPAVPEILGGAGFPCHWWSLLTLLLCLSSQRHSAYSRSALRYAFQNLRKTPWDLFPGMDLTLANCWQHLRLPVWPLVPIYFWWSTVPVNSLDNRTNRLPITRAMLSSHLAARDLPCFFSDFPAALPCYTKNACCVSKIFFAELIFADGRFLKKFADLIFADLIKFRKNYFHKNLFCTK